MYASILLQALKKPQCGFFNSPDACCQSSIQLPDSVLILEGFSSPLSDSSSFLG